MGVIDRLLRYLLKLIPASEFSIDSTSSIFCITEVIPELEPICIIDLGAMAIDGRSEPYAPLGLKGLARIIGFDASAEECRKLSALTSPDHKYLPYVLYDGSRKTLYITAESSSSSAICIRGWSKPRTLVRVRMRLPKTSPSSAVRSPRSRQWIRTPRIQSRF